MTEQEARQILLMYRPDSADAADPLFAEALALVRQSPELQRWFEQHCALQKAISARFKEIPVPAGLKEQILSEHKAATASFWPKGPAARVTAGVLVAAILVMGVVWSWPYLTRPDEQSFASYRSRMTSYVSRMYGMDLITNDLPTIRTYLATKHAHSDLTLPKGLEQTAVVGCGVLPWQKKSATMVCFHSGNTLPPGQISDLFLFVVDSDATHNPPLSETPEIGKAGEMTTASWRVGNRIYVLAGDGDEAFLRRFL